MPLNSYTSGSKDPMLFLQDYVENALVPHSHLGDLSTSSLILPFVKILGLIVLAFLIKKSQLRYRLIPYLFIGVVGIRIVLWDNPVAIYFYFKTLDASVIGDRQVTILVDRLSHYFTPPEDLRFLAIGSSQTGAVYGNLAKKSSELYKVQFSGLGPTEYYLFGNLLDRFKPEYVLLYLSDFDLGRPPNYAAFKYAPNQWLNVLPYASRFIQHDKSKRAKEGVKDLVLSNLSPEHRFSFVYRGYRNLAFKGDDFAVKKIGNSEGGRISQESIHRYRLANLSDDYYSVSIAMLSLYIEYARKKDVNVIIVQGGYNPRNHTEKNAALRNSADVLLRQLTDKYENATYLGEDILPPFFATDYIDDYHVKGEAGEMLASFVIGYLKNQEKI